MWTPISFRSWIFMIFVWKLNVPWSANFMKSQCLPKERMSILKIVKCKFYTRQLNFKPHKTNEQDACLWLASRILQFELNFNFDVCQDHFAQSLCILHSDCAFKVFKIWFFFKSGEKLCQSCQRPTPIGHCFSFFCDAWCMLFNSLWHLNLYSAIWLYTRGKIQISQWFTGVWKVSKAVFAVLPRHRLKWDNMVENPNNPFLESLVWGITCAYGGR